jgi:hypothetical protein
MSQSISTRSCDATDAAAKLVDQVWTAVKGGFEKLVASLSAEVEPKTFMAFEETMAELVRELGRRIVEKSVNRLEGRVARRERVKYRGLGYTRLRKKTKNRYVSTLFGNVALERSVFRSVDAKQAPEPCIFPLELRLGLTEGVTPALGSRIVRHAAQTPQQQAIQWLREEHNVPMGAGRFRKFVSALSPLMEEHRHPLQVQALLDAMDEARATSGSRKPVLAVGRDGVTMCENKHSFWEVATAATITVFNRGGKRLLTVYLAHSPELGQATMSEMLDDLLTDVLDQWDGPLPALAYVADSGSSESSYFEESLRRMVHPRTGERLRWQRVVDYYHAAERVWTIAEALFGKKNGRSGRWARRMLRLLKNKTNGPKRLLHSVAAHASQQKLGKKRKEAIEKAVNYIRRRTKWMQYSEFRQRHIPIGSGITEAACKTIFTQRFKQSGMRWSRDGADRILSLRVLLLSGVWDQAYSRTLDELASELPVTCEPNTKSPFKTAA